MLEVIFSLNTLWWTLMFIYVPACIGLIGIVLLQQGKGGGFGGGLGGGNTETVFGTKSSQTLPVKMTYAGATLFMTIAVVLSVLSGRLDKGEAPELLEASAGDPSLSTSNSSLTAFGIGTAKVKDDAHDESLNSTAAPEAIEDTTDDDAVEDAAE